MYLIRISRIKKTFRKGYSVTLSYSHVYIYKAYSKCTVAGIKQLEPLTGSGSGSFELNIYLSLPLYLPTFGLGQKKGTGLYEANT